MRKEIIKCDCCAKEVQNAVKVKIPIIAKYDTEDRMITKKIDMCESCANRFCNLYYEIANENNYSGLIAFMMESEDSEE